MRTYQVEIIRDSLPAYQGRVADEESGASEFQDNRVEFSDGQLVNVARFNTLPPGRIPALPTFVAIDSVPAGKTVLWTGVVLVQNLNVAVSMFR